MASDNGLRKTIVEERYRAQGVLAHHQPHGCVAVYIWGDRSFVRQGFALPDWKASGKRTRIRSGRFACNSCQLTQTHIYMRTSARCVPGVVLIACTCAECTATSRTELEQALLAGSFDDGDVDSIRGILAQGVNIDVKSNVRVTNWLIPARLRFCMHARRSVELP